MTEGAVATADGDIRGIIREFPVFVGEGLRPSRDTGCGQVARAGFKPAPTDAAVGVFWIPVFTGMTERAVATADGDIRGIIREFPVFVGEALVASRDDGSAFGERAGTSPAPTDCAGGDFWIPVFTGMTEGDVRDDIFVSFGHIIVGGGFPLGFQFII